MNTGQQRLMLKSILSFRVSEEEKQLLRSKSLYTFLPKHTDAREKQ